MKSTVLILLVALIGVSIEQPVNLDVEWANFKLTYGKKYQTTEEEAIRKQAFADNLAAIQRHNLKNFESENIDYTLGLNEFSDMTNEEFQQRYTSGLNVNEILKARNMFNESVFVAEVGEDLPDEVDWTKEPNIVSPVKNQGFCGSCWAFAATGCLESLYARKTGKLIEFSEQELLDCSEQYGSLGCSGGLMSQAFQYISDKHGIDTEQSYKYKSGSTGETYQCHRDDKSAVSMRFKEIVTSLNRDENSLKAAVAKIGPISVAMYAMYDFKSYSGGVYNNPECASDIAHLNHGVVLVGYGTTKDGQDYWKIKNSWGTSWGEQGYARIARNKGNLCGVANLPTYPILI